MNDKYQLRASSCCGDLAVKPIDFTSGANPLGPSNKAKNAIRSRLRQISAIHAEGLTHLKSYIAKKEGINEASILFGCGSTALLSTIVECVTPKKMLTPDPVSQRYRSILSKYTMEWKTIPFKAHENFDLAVDDFCNAMTGCDVVFLQNPHNVTGTVFSQEEILKIIDTAEGRGIHLCLDEAYEGYTGMPSLAVRISNSSRALILRTFSTFHALGGLRLGYVIGPPDIINQIGTRLDPSWINSLAPWAALASMKDKGYRRRTLLFIESEKAYICDNVSRIDNVKCFVSPTNILVMVIRFRKDLDAVRERLERYKIKIQTFPDEDGNTCVRFPIQTHRLNAYFVRILKKIMEA